MFGVFFLIRQVRILVNLAVQWRPRIALAAVGLILTVPAYGIDPAPRNITLIGGIAGPKTVRAYIRSFDGGRCFFAHPMILRPGFARIEVLASRDRLPAVQRLDKEFKVRMGFEAFIRLRLITPEQCQLAAFLESRGKRAIDRRLSIHLAKDKITSGGALSGKILGGPATRLYIYDPSARLVDVTRYVVRANGEVGFHLPNVSGTGPMILIAMRGDRPKARAITITGAKLDQILKAARGKGAVALAFFKAR